MMGIAYVAIPIITTWCARAAAKPLKLKAEQLKNGLKQWPMNMALGMLGIPPKSSVSARSASSYAFPNLLSRDEYSSIAFHNVLRVTSGHSTSIKTNSA